MAPVLATLSGVSFAYPGKTGKALEEVSCQLPAGKVVGILGQNGSGKSTFLRLLLGQLAPCQGSLEKAPGRWAYLPESPFLLGELAAAAYVHPLRCAKPRLSELLQLLACADFFRRPGRTLSSGQRRRLELALILASPAQAVALDEPEMGLDLLRLKLLGELFRHMTAQGQSLFLATHAPGHLAAFFDYLLVFAQGRLLYAGSPAEARTSPEFASSPSGEAFLASFSGG
jgi:ABC-type multidrug transport system ATPase subunit